MKNIKPLLLQVPYESDMGTVLQIARSEAQKVLRCEKVKVVDLIKWEHGWIAMCINNDGSSNEQDVAHKSHG